MAVNTCLFCLPHYIRKDKAAKVIEHYAIKTYGEWIYRMYQTWGGGVSYGKLYRYNPEHLCPKLNGYGGNVQRSLKL
jgi:hypothetical protein